MGIEDKYLKEEYYNKKENYVKDIKKYFNDVQESVIEFREALDRSSNVMPEEWNNAITGKIKKLNDSLRDIKYWLT